MLNLVPDALANAVLVEPLEVEVVVEVLKVEVDEVEVATVDVAVPVLIFSLTLGILKKIRAL